MNIPQFTPSNQWGNAFKDFLKIQKNYFTIIIHVKNVLQKDKECYNS